MLEQHYKTGVAYWLDYFKVYLVPKWSEFHQIVSSRTVTSLFVFTAIIPIIIKMFPANEQVCVKFSVGKFCIPFELPFSATALFVAGSSALIASVIYSMRCPKFVKKYQNSRALSAEGVTPRELYRTTLNFFSQEYRRESVPRFLLFGTLESTDRTVEDLQQDLDEKYEKYCEWAEHEAANNGVTKAQIAASFLFVVKFIQETSSTFDGQVPPKNFWTIIDHDPDRYFWSHYRLQDSSRLLSRLACSAFVWIAYAVLALLYIQNLYVVVSYSMSD